MLRKIRDIILAVVDWFYKPFRKFIPQTIFRYGFTGGMNTLLDIILYYILYNYAFGASNVDLGVVVISPHIAAFITEFHRRLQHIFQHAPVYIRITDDTRAFRSLFLAGLKLRLDQSDQPARFIPEPAADHRQRNRNSPMPCCRYFPYFS